MKAAAIMVSLAGNLTPTPIAEGLAPTTPPVPLPNNKRRVVTPAVSLSSPSNSVKTPNNNSFKKPKKAPSRKKNVSNVPRTGSFGAPWAGSYPDLDLNNVEPNTLILGTHPSIKSLAREQYSGHPMK
jgi:hypothetical protein